MARSVFVSFLLEVKVEAAAQVAFRITDPLNGWASSASSQNESGASL